MKAGKESIGITNWLLTRRNAGELKAYLFLTTFMDENKPN